MIKVTLVDPPDDQGRSVAIDWGKTPGTYIRLTKRQWLDLVHEIDRLREAEGWTVVPMGDRRRLPAAGSTDGASAAPSS